MRSKTCVQLGRRIRALRRLRGLTQDDLARKAEIARESLVIIEKGDRDVRISVAGRIAHALGITIAELMDGVN